MLSCKRPTKKLDLLKRMQTQAIPEGYITSYNWMFRARGDDVSAGAECHAPAGFEMTHTTQGPWIPRPGLLCTTDHERTLGSDIAIAIYVTVDFKRSAASLVRYKLKLHCLLNQYER